MSGLVDAVVTELEQRWGVEIRRNMPVESLRRSGECWTFVVRTTDDAENGEHATDEPDEIPADVVVVATPEAPALALLSPLDSGLSDIEPIVPPRVDLVTLVIDDLRLDAYPRGTGMLVAPGAGLTAKAMTHATAKWSWLADEAGGGAPHLDDARHRTRPGERRRVTPHHVGRLGARRGHGSARAVHERS